MEDLSKSQFILLVLLVSFVTSVATAIVTAALIDQAPRPVTDTIHRVVETVKSGNTDENAKANTQKTLIITEEERVTTITAQTAPSVVSVIATKDVPVLTRCLTSPFGSDDLFSQLFPEFQVPGICQDEKTQRQRISSGSGFFVSSNGLIVTNKHVVSDTNADYSVIFNNGDSLPAEVVARDPFQDIAILKVEGDSHPALPLGDSDQLQIGRSVIAIGNTLGEFQNTVSVGVISGLHRTINAVSAGSIEELRSLIQTDAAINPGNSGGPLITLDGKVIGMNTAVAQGAENVGFALPINVVKKDIEDIEKFGKIVYPFLGIRYVLVTEDLAKKQNLAVTYGALIQGDETHLAVVKGSPADAAGLQEGDIILELGGEQIGTENPLSIVIQKYRPSDTIPVKVLKYSGGEKNIQIQLGEYQPS